MHKDLDYPSDEQLQKGAEIVESHDEGQSDIKEEDCSVKDLTAVSNGEQEENEIVKENDMAENPKEEEVNEEVLVVPDEHNEKQDKEEDIKIQEPSTEASEDKNEVIEGLENAGPEKEAGELAIEEDLVPEYSKTSIEKEEADDGLEKEKVIEGLEVVGEEKDIEKHIIDDDDVVEDHSKGTSHKEPLKDGHSEEETSESAIAYSDRDIKEPTVEEDIVKEPLDDYHDEKKMTGGSKVVGAEYTGENISEKGVLSGQSENSIMEKPSEEGHEEEKAIEELETTSADQDTKEPIMEGVAVSDHSITNIKDEQVRDGNEQSEKTEELEIAGIDNSTEEPISEEVHPNHSASISPVESVSESYEENVKDNGETINVEDIVQNTSKTNTEDEQIKENHNDDKAINESEILAADKEIREPIIGEHVAEDNYTTTIEDSQEESKETGGSESLENVEETIVLNDIVPDHSETSIKEEAIKDGLKDEKENEEIEITAVDKSIAEPITEEVVPDHSTTITNDESVEDSHEEKVSGGSELAGTDKDIQDTVKEEDVVPDYSETTTVDEQASRNGDKLNEDQEISVEDKSIVQPLTKEVVSDYFTTVTEDGHEESKVSGGSQVASDEAVEETSIEKDTVPAYSKTIVKDEPIKDVDDEVKASEETDIVGEEKNIGEPITEEVAQKHSTYISGDEPAEDNHEEKVSGGLEIAVADKDIGDNVKEEDVFTDPIETPHTEEQIEEVHNEEKLTEELEIASVSKDIEKPLMEEAAFPDYTTTIPEDGPEESKVTEGSQTTGTEDMREATTEKEISPDDSEATTREEPIIDGHEEEKINEELETASADDTTRKPILEEVGLDHSGTIIENNSNKDSIEESKVAEESQIVGEDKNIEEIPCNSETTVGEDINQEHNEKEKYIEEIEKDSADQDIAEPITEEAIVPTCSATIIEDEPIEAARLIQVIQERDIDDASITGLPAVSGSDKTTKEDSQEDTIDISKHEVEAKESDLSMEPAAEEQDSTEKVKRVDLVEEENEHMNHDVDNVIETKEEEKVPNDISEDHSHTANELNYEAADKAEEIEKVHSKDGEDLHEIQETDENKETTEQEEMHNESSEMLGETSSLAPFVSEEQTNKETIEEEKSRNTETVESNDSNITQQLLQDSEIADAKPEEKVHGEDGGIPKEEVHNVEFREMNQEPEIVTPQTQEEKTIDEETSLMQKGETESIKLEETDETDSTELTGQKNIELEPKREGQDEIYPSIVEHSTITSAENEEICAEPAVADLTENTESAKERSPILEDVTSVHDVEETIDVSRKEEKEDSSNPSGEISEILEVSGASRDHEELGIEEKEEEHETVQGAFGDKSIEEQTPRELPAESGTDSLEGQLSKENSQQDEVYEELESVAAKDDAENLTMDTEQTKVGPQEDGGIETPGEEAKDSDSVSAMVATNSTEEREILPLEEERDPKKSHDAFIATETPLEENTSTERSTEIDNSTKSLVSEEQDIDEVPEKTMSTSDNHESDSSTSLTEKLSLCDAELEPEVGELIDDSDISSKGIFSTATEGNSASSRDSTVEDVERKEDNTTDNVLVAETLVADEVEHKHSQIQEETSDDISEEEPQETSTLVSDKHESDETKMKEKTQDKSILEDGIEDKLEAPLVSETIGEENFEVEGNVKLDEDAEMGVGGTEQKISISESEPLKLVSEPQVGGVVLDSEESIQTNEFRDDNILEASEIDATKMGINKETYGLKQNATLAQDAEAVDPCEDFPKDTESADQDQCPEVPPETEKTIFMKDGEIIDEQDAVSAEDPTIDDSIQEKMKENNHLKKVDTYLDAEDEKLEAMSFEKPSDLASQIPTFNNEKTDQESGLVEKNVELETYLSAGDQKLDELMTPEKSSDLVSQIPTLNNEKIDQDSAVVDKNVEDIIESDMPVKNTEESSKKNVEDMIESDLPVKNTEECSEKNREDIIESDIPVKNTKESSEKNMEDIIESDMPVMSIEESSEKNIEDMIESDISVKNTESSENDQKNVEASIPRELIEATELVYQENTNNNIPIAPSLGEETSLGYVGDANAEEILQEGKEEDVIKKAIHVSKDDETNKSNEGTLADEVPKYLENASGIQNDERQSLGETDAPKEYVQELSGDNAYLASLKESEEKGDNVDEEAAMLVNDEQVTVSNAEKSKGDDTYEAKAPEDSTLNQEVPEGSEDTFAGHKIGEQMIEEGVKEPNLVAASRESIQLARQGEDVEGEGAEEVSTTSEPEKIYPEKDSVTDESSNANETSKNEVAHEMLTSHEVVFLEEEVLKQEDFTGRPVTSIVNPDQNVPSEETPIQVSKHLEEESVYAPEDVTRETLSKASDAEGRIPTDPSETESFNDIEKPADSVSVTMPMSVKEISPTEEEIPTDNASVSSLTEAPREQIREKEGNCFEDEEEQEMAYTKKGTNEESGEVIEREIPLVQTSEGIKTNELNLQEKSCANEEGEPQLSILPDTSDAPAPKQISIEAEPIQKTEEKSSDSNTDVSSFSKGVIEKSLQEDEIDDVKHGEALRHDSQVNDAKYNTDKEMNSSDEINTNVKSSEDGASSSDMMDKSSNGSLQTVEQSEEGNPPRHKRLESNKALTIEIKDAEKTDQKEKDEEGEEDEVDDDEEHKKDDSGSDAPVMVEASKDIDMKTTPKKSHGILHGVGSKVKHSISKVKKAITGKSSPHKQSSPKS